MDGAIVHLDERPAQEIRDAFPWLKHLRPEHRIQFYRELFSALSQAWLSRDWHPVETLLESWEATAEVLADAELTAWLAEPIEAGTWEDWDDVEAALFGSTA